MSLRKSETLGRWTLLDTFCLHFWAWLLNTVAITPKSEDKKCPKVFNVPEFHFSEVYFFQNWYFNKILNPLFICWSLLSCQIHLILEFSQKVIWDSLSDLVIWSWKSPEHGLRTLVRKSPSLHSQKFTPTPKFIGTSEAYFVWHIGPNFQISLIYSLIGVGCS